MTTIADNLKQSALLVGVSDSPRIDVEVLLAAVLHKDRTYLYTWPEATLTATQQQRFSDYMQQRIKGKPIAYITGEKEFWSLMLWVNQETLIPRPDTEIVVETALSLLNNHTDNQHKPVQVIDLGTGTGAIALALASEQPAWQITAVDSSEAACQLAERNRARHQLDNVSIVCSDWLSSVNISAVDMVVSNPPYIAEHDPHLDQGDVRFEPLSALTAKNNGLADIEKIASQSLPILNEHGWLLMEHGYQQAEQVQAILVANGYQSCRTVNDLSGQPRVTIGQKCAVAVSGHVDFDEVHEGANSGVTTGLTQAPQLGDCHDDG